MGPIQVVVTDANNLVLEVTPTPSTTVILDRGIAGPVGPAGPGDVNGPASATDNAVARFDGTTGKLIQNSVVLVSDTGAVSGVTDLTASGAVTLSGGTANGVAYLNGSKVLTTGSVLTFDGTRLGVGISPTQSIDANGTILARTNLIAYGALVLQRSSSSLELPVAAYTNGSGSILSGGTKGDIVAFGNAGGDGVIFANSNAEQMRLTSTGLGIGTSSPSEKLEVYGTTPIFQINDRGLYQAQFGLIGNDLEIRGSSGAIEFYTGAADGASSTLRATLDSSGNLGLGIAPSAWGSGLKALQIGPQSSLNSGDTAFTAATRLSTNAYSEASAVYKRIDSGFATSYYQQGGAHYWETAGSSTAGSTISFSTPMVLDASGRLLIGGTSTYDFNGQANLVVNGTSNLATITVASTTSGYIAFADGTTGTARYAGNISYSHTTNAMSFGTDGVFSRVTIGSSGNLGIGTDGEPMRLAMTGTIADSTYPLIKGTVRAPYTGGWGSLAPETTIGGYQLFTYRNETGEINKSSAIEVYLANNTYGAGITGMRFITGGYNATNGSEAMRINELQNVGIGTNNPLARLNVQDDQTGTNDSSKGQLIISGASNSNKRLNIGFNTTDDVGWIQAGVNGIGYNSLLLQSQGGNVGIGTTSPQNKLQVKATVRPQLSVSYDGTTGLYLEDSSNSFGKSWKIATSSAVNSQLEFYQSTATSGVPVWAASAAMTLDASGNLLVGTTSNADGNRLNVVGGSIGVTASGASFNLLNLKDSVDQSGATFIQFANSAGTNIGNINRVGTTNAVAYNTTSDYRLKTVVGSVTGQGSRIDALKPIDYLWTEGGQQARGFLAHEFQTVYPNSVSGDKDAVDANGNPKYQAMQAATSEVIADLVAEIQSLRQRLAAAGI